MNSQTDGADLSFEGNPLLITSGGQNMANPRERVVLNNKGHKCHCQDVALACMFMLILIFAVVMFSSSPSKSVPFLSTQATSKPHLPPTNEKILLSSREDIDEFFDKISDKRIFFVSVPGTVDYLTKMAMCAVESAAHFNPDYDVILLQGFYEGTAKSDGLSGTASKSAYEGILNLPNVYFADFNISEHVRGTAVEELWNNTLSTAKNHRHLHIADTLRMSLLYEYGGFYSDLDAIFFKSISNYSNAIGYEGQIRGNDPGKGYQVVNNAVLAFDKHHPFVGEYIDRWRNEYNNTKKIWAVVIATVLGSECTDNPELEFCKGVTFVDSGEFYMINWDGIGHYTQLRDANPVKFDRAFDRHTSKSIAHLWNSFKENSNMFPFRAGDVSTTNDMYGALMNYGCPFVFEHQQD